MLRLLVPVLTSSGLVGGFAAARASGVRAIGGAVLGVVGATAFAAVTRAGGPWRAAAVVAAYLAAFGASHPLAKRLGAWPAVAVAAAVSAIPAAALSGRRRRTGRRGSAGASRLRSRRSRRGRPGRGR